MGDYSETMTEKQAEHLLLAVMHLDTLLNRLTRSAPPGTTQETP